MKKNRIIIACLITLLLFVVSRITGPNFRYRVSLEEQGAVFSHKAPRTNEGTGPALLELEVTGQTSQVSKVSLTGNPRGADTPSAVIAPSGIETDPDGRVRYQFTIPPHKWATKYDYFFRIQLADGRQAELKRGGESMTVRFRGEVPAFWLALHILGMFGGFLLVVLAAFGAYDLIRGRGEHAPVFKLGGWAWVILFVGGLPLGFMMNWYAFRVLWEAWPFGNDVTDNKTQVALLIYGIGLLAFDRIKSRAAGWVVLAATAAVIAVFLIPHSI